jgi:hypothetical protein
MLCSNLLNKQGDLKPYTAVFILGKQKVSERTQALLSLVNRFNETLFSKKSKASSCRNFLNASL